MKDEINKERINHLKEMLRKAGLEGIVELKSGDNNE